MLKFTSLLLILTLTVSAADEGAHKVKYSGGTLAIKNGDDIKLFVDEAQLRIAYKKEGALLIPAVAITEISYGQEVHRRIGSAAALAVFTFGIGAIVAFSKSKKHYVGVLWDDAVAGKKGGIVLQADKDEYRGLLAGLEGITGKKAVDADAEAAKEKK
jgi:hypothetical protein